MFGWFSRLSLRRIITQGTFIPEVDGFRFLAILIVILAHAWGLFGTPAVNRTLPLYLRREVVNGKVGVYLFFAISGFILALPFAKNHLLHARPVSLLRYFKRRVTRLEPPYVILMLLRFPLLLLYKHDSFKAMAPHLGASLLYLHNLIYGYSSVIYPAAWSLEIEVQFYILAPLLATIYTIKSTTLRQLLLIGLIIGTAVLSALLIVSGSRVSYSILNYFQYFLAGFLLCDLYLTGNYLSISSWLWDAVGILSLLLILLSNGIFAAVIAPLAMISLYLSGFHGKLVRMFFSLPAITIIGGMCYSLYLTHMLALTSISSMVTHWPWMNSNHDLATLLEIGMCLSFTLIVGTIYFVLIERPCMYPDWPSRLAKRVANILRAPSEEPAN